MLIQAAGLALLASLTPTGLLVSANLKLIAAGDSPMIEPQLAPPEVNWASNAV